MSLMHWWPLNGDTNNYGISNEQATASNPVYVNGKIGKSMHTGTLSFSAEQWKKTIRNTMSIAMWIYTRADGNYSAGTPFFGTGGMTKPNNRKFSMFHYPDKTTLHCSWQSDDHDGSIPPYIYWGCSVTNFFEINQWVHLCLVQDAAAGTITLYRNGVQTGQWEVPDLATLNICQAAAAPIRNNIDYQQINDIRIYDHALSPIEVKELSKALVVHYTFDNTISSPTLVSSFEQWAEYIDDSGLTYTEPAGAPHYGTKIIQDNTVLVQSVNQNSRLRWEENPEVHAGEKYTVSIKYKQLSGDQTFRWQIQEYINTDVIATYWTNNTQQEIMLDDGWKIIYYHLTIQNNANLRIWLQEGADYTRYTQSYYLKDFCVEREHTYTPGMRGIDLELQNETGLTTPPTLNDFYLSLGAKIGRYCGQFNGSTTYIEFPMIKPDMFTTDYTLNFWVYHNEGDGRAVYFGDYDTTNSMQFNIERHDITGCRKKLRYYHASSPDHCFDLVIPDKAWTMVTLKYVQSEGKLYAYLNGDITNKQSLSHTSTLTKTEGIMRIGRDNRSGSTALGGYMDDFRLYATALDDADIQDLYNCGGAISDRGDVFTGSFIEGAANTQVKQNHTFEAKNFYESILPLGYEQLEYIENKGTAYIDTGVKTSANITRLETHHKQTTLPSNQILFGSYDGVNPNYFYQKETTTTYHRINWNNSDLHNRDVSLTANQEIRGILKLENNTMSFESNGIKISGTLSRNSSSSNQTYYLFGYNRQGSYSSQYAYPCQLYSFKIYVDNIIVRNYVPAREKSSGHIGLYDIINNQFYKHAGSSAFEPGPTITFAETAITQSGLAAREIIEI